MDFSYSGRGVTEQLLRSASPMRPSDPITSSRRSGPAAEAGKVGCRTCHWGFHCLWQTSARYGRSAAIAGRTSGNHPAAQRRIFERLRKCRACSLRPHWLPRSGPATPALKVASWLRSRMRQPAHARQIQAQHRARAGRRCQVPDHAGAAAIRNHDDVVGSGVIEQLAHLVAGFRNATPSTARSTYAEAQLQPVRQAWPKLARIRASASMLIFGCCGGWPANWRQASGRLISLRGLPGRFFRRNCNASGLRGIRNRIISQPFQRLTLYFPKKNAQLRLLRTAKDGDGWRHVMRCLQQSNCAFMPGELSDYAKPFILPALAICRGGRFMRKPQLIPLPKWASHPAAGASSGLAR